MDTSKKTDGIETSQPEKKYPTQKLLRSRHLAGYQRDFAKVILTEPAYTISEAKAVLDKVLKEKERK